MSGTIVDSLAAMARRIRERVPPEVRVRVEPDDGYGGQIVVACSPPELGELTLGPGVHTDGDVLEPDRQGAWSLSESYPGGFGPVGVYREADVPEAVWRWGREDAGPYSWLKDHDLREPWFAQREARERAEYERAQARRRREETARLAAWLLERFPQLRGAYSAEEMTERAGQLVAEGWRVDPGWPPSRARDVRRTPPIPFSSGDEQEPPF